MKNTNTRYFFTVLSSVFYTITISSGFLEDNYLPNVVCTIFIFFVNLFQELILYRLGKEFLVSLASNGKAKIKTRLEMS